MQILGTLGLNLLMDRSLCVVIKQKISLTPNTLSMILMDINLKKKHQGVIKSTAREITVAYLHQHTAFADGLGLLLEVQSWPLQIHTHRLCRLAQIFELAEWNGIQDTRVFW